MPRKPLGDAEHIHLVFPAAMISDLDAWVVELQQSGQVGLSSITRSALIRDLIERAVRDHKQAASPKRPKK